MYDLFSLELIVKTPPLFNCKNVQAVLEVMMIDF